MTPSSEFDGVEAEAGSEGDHQETDSEAASTVHSASSKYSCHNLRFNQVIQLSHQLPRNWIPTNLQAKVGATSAYLRLATEN